MSPILWRDGKRVRDQTFFHSRLRPDDHLAGIRPSCVVLSGCLGSLSLGPVLSGQSSVGALAADSEIQGLAYALADEVVVMLPRLG